MTDHPDESAPGNPDNPTHTPAAEPTLDPDIRALERGTVERLLAACPDCCAAVATAKDMTVPARRTAYAQVSRCLRSRFARERAQVAEVRSSADAELTDAERAALADAATHARIQSAPLVHLGYGPPVAQHSWAALPSSQWSGVAAMCATLALAFGFAAASHAVRAADGAAPPNPSHLAPAPGSAEGSPAALPGRDPEADEPPG